jgi:hypothetical protein
MRKVIVVLVMILAMVLVAAIPAFAHNRCDNGNGVERYDHAHGQSKEAVQLCLPEKAENGVHGNFHD